MLEGKALSIEHYLCVILAFVLIGFHSGVGLDGMNTIQPVKHVVDIETTARKIMENDAPPGASAGSVLGPQRPRLHTRALDWLDVSRRETQKQTILVATQIQARTDLTTPTTIKIITPTITNPSLMCVLSNRGWLTVSPRREQTAKHAVIRVGTIYQFIFAI
jgi:hypothetical protein